MAKNSLTPEQDLITREFFLLVADKAEGLLPGAPAYGRQLRAICLLLLNYDVNPTGGFMEKGSVITRTFHGNDYGDIVDEWPADAARAQARFDNEATDNTDTSEASTSESSEDTEVREAVLPQDVS